MTRLSEKRDMQDALVNYRIGIALSMASWPSEDAGISAAELDHRELGVIKQSLKDFSSIFPFV